MVVYRVETVLQMVSSRNLYTFLYPAKERSQLRFRTVPGRKSEVVWLHPFRIIEDHSPNPGIRLLGLHDRLRRGRRDIRVAGRSYTYLSLPL
jgi:hypothetical protein